MARRLYGSLTNRLEENKQFVPEITIGTGVTEYFYSDRHPYEVIEVKDQKHITIRAMKHEHIGDTHMDNNWKLTSDETAHPIRIVKRGNFWYTVSEITPEEAKEIYEGTDIEAKLWACHNNFDLQAIIASGKTKRTYHKRNLSFGTAQYYYDYEF